MDGEGGRTRYVLVVRLPRPLEVRIEDAMLGLPGATKPVMGYHITVLGPFFLTEGTDAASLDVFAGTCARHEPFEVRIGGVGVFEAKQDRAVYLRVEPSAPLAALHDALLESSRHAVEMQHDRAKAWNESAFEPHVTLGLGLTDNELPRLLDSAQALSLDEVFSVETIGLCEQSPSGPWQYVAQYALGASPSPASDWERT